jgi:hypothetical protein
VELTTLDKRECCVASEATFAGTANGMVRPRSPSPR